MNKGKIFIGLVVLCFLGITQFCAAEYVIEPYSSAVKPEETALVNRWLGFLIRNGAEADVARYSPAIPFSFVCGDRPSTEWIKPDNAKIESGNWINDTRIYTLRWNDEQTKLSCEMQLTEYRHFPAMSWTVFLKNEGTTDTAPIHDFKALDTYWKRTDGSMPILYRSQGSDGRTDDFVYVGEEMRKSMWTHSRTVRMDYQTNSDFRRASNYSLFDSDTRPSATWLPFFNLQTGTDGLIIGIGWNGLWFAEIGHDGNGNCPLSAGMQHLNTKLLPGESIRSPLMLVVYWSGESMHGQNLFRQLILSHFHPQKDGKPLQMPICCGTWGGWSNQRHLDFIKTIVEKKLPYNYYWIDAGWYGKSETDCPNVFQGDWGTVGDWIVNKYRHPDTLKPVSEAIQKANMKFLLWFEPIRTTRGTDTATAHPEWFVDIGNENLLLDLGNSEAKKYITETISGLITENGIDCYREDFNFDPFPYWTHQETPDRAGISEMRFVEGVYAYWDELLRRHPNLVIDNCASGGRRIELETMKRSMPFWRTDYNCFPYLLTEATQAHTFGIAHWLPANSISPFVEQPDTYQFRSALSSGMAANLDDLGTRPIAERTEEEWNWWQTRIEEAQRAKPFFYGDFYPLTVGNYALESWLAYHFYLPEQKSGLIVAFRRPKSDVVSMTFDLTTIKPDANYEFEDADTGKTVTRSGKEIRKNGYTLKTNAPRESRLVYYRQIE
ncbi:MAG: alpha-galactosidase [Planctomycetaceae bacterium]|jgi:alpha-galactosidase|nr:alpha-galactosidase [Planctomycetaceae bacterium]